MLETQCEIRTELLRLTSIMEEASRSRIEEQAAKELQDMSCQQIANLFGAIGKNSKPSLNEEEIISRFDSVGRIAGSVTTVCICLQAVKTLLKEN